MTDRTGFPYAPGCFASALTYKDDQLECQNCSFAVHCKPRSEANLTALRAKMGLAPKESKPKEQRFEEKPVGSVVSYTLPKKVEELINRIERAGIRVTEGLRTGVNPFTTRKPSFMFLTAHLLIGLEKKGRGISRTDLRRAFMMRFNWSYGTANSHAIQACQAFVAMGACSEDNGELRIRMQ